MLATTRYDAFVVNTPIIDSFTADTDMDVWCLGMWMGGSASRACTVEFEIELTIDGVRYI